MIRVVKPTAPPAVLLTTGAVHRQSHCDDFDAAPDEYRSGARTFDIADVYRADEVKEALRVAQHGKCAFCESYFKHIAFGDVEHFRPKGGYRRRDGDPLRQPGYYWLAYEWSNLFYSCQLCNQQFKRNLFPLRDNRRRARSHRSDLASEQPLLIDPAAHDPAAHIGFRGEYAFARNGSREGETTIAVLGLNREGLAEVRRKRLQDLRILSELCDELRAAVATNPGPLRQAQLRERERELRERLADDAEYAALARAFVTP